MTTRVNLTHFHLCCGLGGAAKGFNQAVSRLGNLEATWECLGGVDVDAAGLEDFKRLTGVNGTLLDLFDRQQYIDFHGKEPPAGWREATPDDIRRAAQHRNPSAAIISAPCKGFSGLLPDEKSKSSKYAALNKLTLRSIWLMMEAFKDEPPEFCLFENVPLVASRGRPLIDQITSLLGAYGYACAETVHDCGELGGLAQSRKRFLLVARFMAKVPAMLYVPQKQSLATVGSLLGRMPLPGDEKAGPMHRVPRLSWKTWTRLALVEAGKDWRSLRRLNAVDGWLQDYMLVPDMHNGVLGVRSWNETTGTVTGKSRPTNGAFAVADVRFEQSAKWKDGQAYGVHEWQGTTGVIGGQQNPGQGKYSVADPRLSGIRHNNVLRVVRMSDVSPSITGGSGPTAGGLAVADPRSTGQAFAKYAVTAWEGPSGTVIAGSTTGQGAYAVADSRHGAMHRYVTDATTEGLPAPDDKLVAVIRSLDGTWHRPFTTLEVAALQSLYDPDEALAMSADDAGFILHGRNDQSHRERIGNAIPCKSAQAVATEIGRAVLASRTGDTFVLSSSPVWVRPIAVAISVAGLAG